MPSADPRPPQALEKWLRLPSEKIEAQINDTRTRTLELVDDLSDAQWDGDPSPIANPIRWEIGHVANFYERFLLYELGRTEPLIANGYALYNSFALDRDDRWDTPLPSRRGTLEYLRHVTWYVVEWLRQNEPDAWETYLFLTAAHHEDMHVEALTWYRQTLSLPEPLPNRRARPQALDEPTTGGLSGDVAVPGGTLLCGATADQSYVWDNEKWGHPVEVSDFRIARAPVTQAEYAEFVSAGGYDEPEYWSFEGWRWRSREEVKHPLYWRLLDGSWQRRHFDRWVPLEPNRPMVHINLHEAQAYCRWAGRRLPSEAEWELAASGTPAEQREAGARKRTYPWGESVPTSAHAALDGGTVGCVDVADFSAGDSAYGCRQMVGNVWEWTESAFYPYPGYAVDTPYREYSAPWFGNHHVLRGGSWATQSRLIRNTYRNFFQPHRRDIIAGFRTCAA